MIHLDDVEPSACPDCLGDGTVTILAGRWLPQRVPCERCLGDGAIEPRP